MTQVSPSAEGSGTAKAGPLPGADEYTFRADDPAGLEYDVFRLDCAVEALRGADLTPLRANLQRIASNLNDLMENTNGHAH